MITGILGHFLWIFCSRHPQALLPEAVQDAGDIQDADAQQSDYQNGLPRAPGRLDILQVRCRHAHLKMCWVQGQARSATVLRPALFRRSLQPAPPSNRPMPWSQPRVLQPRCTCPSEWRTEHVKHCRVKPQAPSLHERQCSLTQVDLVVPTGPGSFLNCLSVASSRLPDFYLPHK